MTWTATFYNAGAIFESAVPFTPDGADSAVAELYRPFLERHLRGCYSGESCACATTHVAICRHGNAVRVVRVCVGNTQWGIDKPSQDDVRAILAAPGAVIATASRETAPCVRTNMMYCRRGGLGAAPPAPLALPHGNMTHGLIRVRHHQKIRPGRI
jgi:hypothetical protein